MSTWLRASFHRLVSFFRRAKLEEDLDAELTAHLELAIEDNLARGMPAEESRRQALIRFGGRQQAREQHREARGLPVLDILLQDLRFAVRQLLKSPGFTAAAVLTLALGIAVNATMFSMVSAFLLRRPPGRDPERVAVVSSVSPAPGFHADAQPVSAPNYLAWRGANHVFEDMAAADEDRTVSFSPQSSTTGRSGAAGEPETLRSAAVSPNYFSVLSVSPEFGRVFEAGEDQPGREHVVILSWDLWQRRFASDASVIGRVVHLNRENYTVVGVMPASFRLLGYTAQVWTPLVLNAADQTAAARKDRSLLLIARLKGGATLEQARAEFATLAGRAVESFPDTETGWSAEVRSLPDFLIYNFEIRNGLAVLMTTVGFVLLIACANVAGLLLARGSERRKELAIRIALGAGRLRIVRQLLTEGLLIALLGGGTGLLLSYWGVSFVRANLTFNEAISAVPLSLDWNVVLFALAVSCVCAALCGIAPALNASRTDINASLKNESRAASASRSHTRLRTAMVTGETALALFLLVGAGLLFKGIFVVEHQNLGFRPDHLLTAGIILDNAKYKNTSQKTEFVQELMARLQHIPSAQAVAFASDLPAAGAGTVTLQIKGQPELPGDQRLSARDAVVSAGYFQTAGIPLLRGRTFTENDSVGAPRVVLVNQEFVHRHLHDQEVLGKQIRLDVSGVALEWSEIVGIVDNVKTYSEETRDDPEVYEPFFQRPVSSFSLMLRTSSDPSSVAPALRETVAQIDSELPLASVMSMPALIERQKGGDPFLIRVLGGFAVLALILAAIGIYGLIAYSVGQRTHEIGIRMALGARGPHVLRIVLWQGMKMAAAGAALGLLLALPLPKVFDAMFYGIHLREPRLYVIVPAAILAVAMLATYIPARRATRVDPLVALHQE